MARTSEHSNGSGARVRELVAERDRLRAWIDRLDSLDDATPQHIATRVRSDYGERLEAITAELTEHVQAVRDDLKEARERLASAEEGHREAMDRLEEVRLRHRIGELDADSWEEQRPALEATRDEADEARAGVAAEVETLEALLVEIETPPEAPAPAAPPEEAAQPEAEPGGDEPSEDEPGEEWEPVIVGADDGEGDDDFDAAFEAFSGEGGEERSSGSDLDESAEDEDVSLPWLSEVDEEIERGTGAAADREAGRPAGEPAAGGEDDDDLAFLAELDRAIAASEDRQPEERPEPAGVTEGAGSEEEPAAAAGAEKAATIPCPECGAANDARSWYCEVCAAELG
jgi:hypothetical protein